MSQRGTFSVAITNNCNSNCRHCGSQQKPDRPPKHDMDLNTWKAICEKIPDSWTLEINSLGEHTTHPNFLNYVKHLVETRRDKVVFKLSTNGMWPWGDDQTERLLSWLRFLKTVYQMNSYRSQIIFSIDADNKEDFEWIRRGSIFEKVMHNIQYCLEHKEEEVQVGVAFVAMKRNLEQMIPLVEQLPGLDLFYINMLNCCTDDMYPETLFGMEDDYHRAAGAMKAYCDHKGIHIDYMQRVDPGQGEIRGCNFPLYPWLDPHGSIGPCCRRWDHVVGNIKDHSWRDIVQLGRKQSRQFLTDDQCAMCFEAEEAWTWRRHFDNQEYFNRFLGGEWKKND
jgi:MoaA/NifB/PqqE/SkfB family radical SAM enzyme